MPERTTARTRIAALWRDANRTVLDLLFPPRCAGCGRLGREWFCAACTGALQRIAPPFCPRCGSELPSPSAACASCAAHPPPDVLASLHAVARYADPLRPAIHALKYNGRTVLAEPLGALLAAELATLALPASLIVPVPLHKQRERQRGYNQSALLAAEVGRRCGLPVDRDALVRDRNTEPQVSMHSAAERRANIAGAFRARRALPGEKILLIDDVATTGATLANCAIELAAAGAGIVWGLTLAR
ncbi:MAG: ComF family protein [Chloroflexi bacterium]|nr:ComF family protein [Chloroflexota bacterium]